MALSKIDAANFLTGTIPSGNIATSSLAAAATGKVLQVVQDTLTSEFSTSSSTYADTGLTLSITPTASDSTLYITAIMNGVTHNGVSFASCKMFEDSTELEEWSGVSGYADNTSNSVTLCLQRSASSTSARTYKIQMANKPNTGGTLRINNRVASGESCQSNMMIMEVLA